MTHYLLTGLVALTAAIHTCAQQTVNWGPAISVADGSVYGNVRPRLALTTGNQPIVIFGKSGNGDLYVAKGDGTTFQTPVDVLPANVGTYLQYWTGPDIAAHGDTVIAVFKALPFDNGKIYTVRSTDGGVTFSDTIRVDDHNTGRVFLPALAMNAGGNPSVNYMAFTGQSSDPLYAVARSADAGLTFSPGVEASSINSGEACDCCPAEMVIDGNRQVLLFRNNISNVRDIYGSMSVDGGATFPYGDNLEYLSWNITSCPSTGPHGIIMGDSLFSVAASRESGSYRVNVVASAIDDAIGLTFEHLQPAIPPVNTNGSQNYPRISGENDTIVLVWEEKETSNADIFCSVVTDGQISSFSAYKERVNEITTGTQTNPDVLYKDGFVHLVYQDAASGDVIYRKGTIADIAGLTEEVIHTEVYPNPSVEATFVVAGLPAGSWNGSVTDLSGKTVPHTLQAISGGYRVELDPSAEAGIYLLRLENASGQRTQVKLTVSE